MVGHEQIRSEITNRLKISPDGVYLFRGLSGVGKRTFAFECARLLLCLEDAPEKCQCRSCKVFDVHPDFLCLGRYERIKAADIDSLLDFISTVSLLSDRKVIVLDNTDDVSRGSINKLLKLLEECSPNYTYFLISSDDLPFTLSSRATEYRFNSLTSKEATWVAKKKLGYDHHKAAILGIFSEMAVDEVLLRAGHYLRYRDEVVDFITWFKKKDPPDFLDYIDGLDNPEVFLNVLLMAFTEMILAKNGLEVKMEKFGKISDTYNDKGLVYSVSILSRVRRYRKLNINMNMALKNALLKIYPVLKS